MNKTDNINTLTINSKKVSDFYNKYNTIDITVMNELFVDILNNILSTMSNNVTTNMMSSILNTLNDTLIKQDLSMKQNELYYNNLKDNINKVSTDILTNITLKLHDIKQSYINDLKDIISRNDSDISIKLSNILDKNTSNIIDKTTSVLSQIIPNSNDNLKTTFEKTLDNFKNSIKLDNYDLLKDLLNKNNNIDTRVQDFIHTLDNRFNDLILHIHTPINNYINSSEERVNNNINKINELSIGIHNKQDELTTNINDFINRFRTASNKGQYGEGLLFNILTQLYPTAEIIDTTNDATNRCDFVIKRLEKAEILIENKDHTRNVNIDEVNKYLRDSNKHNLHSILFSQKSGIISKPNWFIEIYNNRVRLYVHNVNYSSDIIKLAIDVVDTLSYHLGNINEKVENIKENIMDEETLLLINNEVKDFIEKRTSIISLINEQHNLLVNKCNELIISPSLLRILDKKYSSVSQTDPLLCKYCLLYKARNHAGLSAHLRGCKSKNFTSTHNSTSNSSSNNDNSINYDTTSYSNDNLDISPKTTRKK